MNAEELREAILRKYPTLKEFAEKVGTTDSQVSRWIKRPSARFKAILKNEGITISDDMVKSEREIEDYGTIVKELKSIIYEKNNYIKDLQKLLVTKDKIIDQLTSVIDINERIKD